MPTPAAPRAPHRNSPNAIPSIVAAVIALLVLLGLAGQCDSPAGDSAPTTSAPTTPPAPVEPAPQPGGGEATIPDDITPPPPPALAPAPAPPPADDYNVDNGRDDSDGFAYYKNCSAARAAGAAPLYAGEPGYSSDLDRDGDGVACES